MKYILFSDGGVRHLQEAEREKPGLERENGNI